MKDYPMHLSKVLQQEAALTSEESAYQPSEVQEDLLAAKVGAEGGQESGDETDDEEDLAEVGLDSDDDLDDDDGAGDEVALWTPDGLCKLDEMPALDKALVKVVVSFKWQQVGWQLGRIRKKLPSNEEGYNFQAYYACEDRVAKHVLTAAAYVNGRAEADISSAPIGSWVAFSASK
ncbi:hypothetical protein CYMTET_8627 [Cymbomonas tetramitiformis]|uniref:Uncharacterized protein n=1 Tax=Cymbomonas tetramitiformis TaxID=36881 RepID=A0AAE0GT87_9CHLO|nr:hypothetical protein CYMTET_8627 [Cymbomonas tetramitiformis]